MIFGAEVIVSDLDARVSWFVPNRVFYKRVVGVEFEVNNLVGGCACTRSRALLARSRARLLSRTSWFGSAAF